MQSTQINPPVTPAGTPAPAKKSNASTIIIILIAAVLSLCCCLPGIYNIIFPMPFTSTTSGMFGDSSSSGTIPAWYGIFCICAAMIPWVAVLVITLVRRPKK